MMEGPGKDQSPNLIISSGNEIGAFGKALGGILILIFTITPLIMIIAFWPDKLPEVGEETEMLYQWGWFKVRYVPDPSKIVSDLAHLNSILFFLVALSGFLGSMIHLSASFTNYIGSEKFKKAWILWYIIKPFTGAGIALILYFVLRAGLLNYGDANNVNLYGVVTLAAFTGLFTDKATIKLEEIFTVIFKPKDERPDKIEADAVNVKLTGIKPEELLIDEDNNLVISGEGLEGKKLTIKINEMDIANPVIKSDSISFSYNIPDELKEAGNVRLQVLDEKGRELYKKILLFKSGDLNDDDEEKEELAESDVIKG